MLGTILKDESLATPRSHKDRASAVLHHLQDVLEIENGVRAADIPFPVSGFPHPARHLGGTCLGVLFEFACAKDSNLGKVGQENGLRVIRLCKEDINLEDPHSIEQFISQ